MFTGSYVTQHIHVQQYVFFKLLQLSLIIARGNGLSTLQILHP